MRRTVSLRVAILAPLAVAAAVVVAASGVVGPGAPFAQAGGQNRAVVVVDTGGSVRAACVLFSENSISGAEALQRAGMAPVFQGYGGLGGAVCSLNGVGCPSDGSCLTCQAPSYWQYWRSNGGGFAYSSAGASSTQVTDGSIEGWSFGGSRTPPPLRSVDAVCGVEAPPPTSPPATQPPSNGGGAGGNGGAGGTGGAGAAGAAGAPGAAAGEADPATSTTTPGESTTTTGGGGEGSVRNGSTAEGGVGSGESDDDGEQATSLIQDVDDGGSPAGSIALTTGVLGALGFFVWRARRRNGADELPELLDAETGSAGGLDPASEPTLGHDGDTDGPGGV